MKLLRVISYILINISLTNFTLANNAPISISGKAVLYPSLANIVEPLIPAVVNIYTVKYNKKQSLKATLPGAFPVEQFNDTFDQLNLPFNLEEMYSDPKAVSLGSGFIIDELGYIVTNHHVVRNADEIYVKIANTNNNELPAKIIGQDKKTDLALIKIESKENLPYVKFGDSNKARIGDPVILIGNPFGFGGTVTTGIISSKGRDVDINISGVVDNFIQTDAQLHSGGSGGPMFNVDGEVIGVNTGFYSTSGVNVGISFAIPSNTAEGIIEQLKRYGKVKRAFLNVSIQEVTDEIAEGLGLKEAIGALVVDLKKGGAADKAGIKSGDVIIEFDGHKVKNNRKLQILVAETPINKEIKIVVLRHGNRIELPCKIIENDSDNSTLNIQDTSKQTIIKNGITFDNLRNEIKEKLSIKDESEGIVITNISKEAQGFGLKVGDIITPIDQQSIRNVNELDKFFDQAKVSGKKNVILLIKRNNISQFVPLPIF